MKGFSSIAALMLTTEALIAEFKGEERMAAVEQSGGSSAECTKRANVPWPTRCEPRQISEKDRQDGGSLGKIKIRNYTCGLAVTIVSTQLSLLCAQLLASLLLFSALFLTMGLIVLGVVVAWHASEQVALWSRLCLAKRDRLDFGRKGSLARCRRGQKSLKGKQFVEALAQIEVIN